jgi:hypothetical protein
MYRLRCTFSSSGTRRNPFTISAVGTPRRHLGKIREAHLDRECENSGGGLDRECENRDARLDREREPGSVLYRECEPMKRALSVRNLCVASLVALGACRPAPGGGGGITPPRGPFELIIVGDVSFRAAHGGHSISVAVLNVVGEVVAEESGTVSSVSDPTFYFSFQALLDPGVVYTLDYWIDSNVGGGSAGVCDPPANDHQTRESFSTQSDRTITLGHDDGNSDEVCSSFP